jgi:hypothetical protein
MKKGQRVLKRCHIKFRCQGITQKKAYYLTFLLSSMFRMALRPIKPPIQWFWGSFPRVKGLEHDTDHKSPSSTKVKNEWSYTSTTVHMPSWHRQQTLHTSTDDHFSWLIINGEKNIFLPLYPEGKE